MFLNSEISGFCFVLLLAHFLQSVAKMIDNF
jgi:hypothetical protein